MRFFAFLGTTTGRWSRVAFSAVLLATSLLWLEGWKRLAVAAFAIVDALGAALNICLLAPFFGGHLDAGRNAEEYGGD